MNIGVLGTGMVGEAIASKLVALGHDVRMGSRSGTNEKAVAWVAGFAGGTRGRASHGSFADAAMHGQIIFNCTAGTASLAALEAAGKANLAAKVLVDVSNPLDFSKGMPPTLTVCNSDSLAEQIQRAYPETKVVKALNTVTATLMVDPKLLPGDHDLFMAGNDAGAKETVASFLREQFGWKVVHDIGDITAARGMEMAVIFWVRMFGAFGTPMFNYRIVK